MQSPVATYQLGRLFAGAVGAPELLMSQVYVQPLLLAKDNSGYRFLKGPPCTSVDNPWGLSEPCISQLACSAVPGGQGGAALCQTRSKYVTLIVGLSTAPLHRCDMAQDMMR